VARDILRDKIEGKGVSRRTAYRRIEEAEKLKLIKFHKGKDAYELYSLCQDCAMARPVAQ